MLPAPHLLFHWSAFGNLTSDRQMGMGIGPVAWTAVDRYAERYGVDDPDEYDRFVRLMRAMDMAFLSWHAEKKD